MSVIIIQRSITELVGRNTIICFLCHSVATHLNLCYLLWNTVVFVCALESARPIVYIQFFLNYTKCIMVIIYENWYILLSIDPIAYRQIMILKSM